MTNDEISNLPIEECKSSIPNNINENAQAETYGAEQITVLEGLEPVRQRPGMYIGSTGPAGLHHLVYEIVDNAVDEALAGYCTNITVIMKKEGYIKVLDNGRGIPVEKHSKTGKSALETVMTVLHAGGKFNKSVYKVSGGLHGVGASVVNALSEHLEVKVYRQGKKFQQEFRYGIPQGEVIQVGDTPYTGTTVKFLPDVKIFDNIIFTYNTILNRLKQSAYLTPQVTFTLINENTTQRERFYFEGGIKTWLSKLVSNQKIISPLLYLNESGEDVMVEVAFQFVDSTNDYILSFANNIPTIDGGMHVLGFKNSLLKIINELATNKGEIDKKIGEFQIHDIVDGLYAIISVKLADPQFEGQTKGKLGNQYVKKEVENIIYNYLKKYFAENDNALINVLEKVKLSAKARLAAKLARETILRKNVLTGGVLPGKLADCSNKNKKNTELFIVEGNSAGGSAKQARNSAFQAILPLRGKILNTEQALLQKILENAEVKSLITAIGAGIKESYEEEKIRYDKIVIMTDADVDGAHIRTLLLTFFFRYMRQLITNGHLYIAQAPIYKIKQGKKELYIYPPENDLNTVLKKNNFDETKTEIQRYKGLGEMNSEQLWDTTMDPAKRKMLIVTIGDAENADKLFRIFMGEDVLSRRHFILTHAKSVKDLDF